MSLMMSAASLENSEVNKIICVSDDISSFLGVPLYYQKNNSSVHNLS